MRIRLGQYLKQVFSGGFLSHDESIRFLPFLLFISFLGILYIGNGYYAESKIRRLNTLNDEIRDLRSEYIISKAELMQVSKQSEVAKAAAYLGLKENIVPPMKIVVSNVETNKNNLQK